MTFKCATFPKSTYEQYVFVSTYALSMQACLGMQVDLSRFDM